MKFSIITVTFNSGDKLKKTIDSVLKQTCDDFEIVVKDGGSTDGSIEKLEGCGFGCVRIVKSKDLGIYDAMNQAIQESLGEFLMFLNAGDTFFSNTVLETLTASDSLEPCTILYGNTYFAQYGTVAKACPKASGFSLYRNMPCHQSIVYARDVLLTKPYDTTYKLRADYEQLLNSFFSGNVKFNYIDTTIAAYEGGGFSESASNRRLAQNESKRASKAHIPAVKRFLYKAILILTLSKVRTWIAHNPKTAEFYESIKKHIIYR